MQNKVVITWDKEDWNESSFRSQWYRYKTGLANNPVFREKVNNKIVRITYEEPKEGQDFGRVEISLVPRSGVKFAILSAGEK